MTIKKGAWSIPRDISVGAFIKALKTVPKGTIDDVASQILFKTRHLPANEKLKATDEDVREYFKKYNTIQNEKVKIQNASGIKIKLTSLKKQRDSKAEEHRKMLLDAGADDSRI